MRSLIRHPSPHGRRARRALGVLVAAACGAAGNTCQTPIGPLPVAPAVEAAVNTLTYDDSLAASDSAAIVAELDARNTVAPPKSKYAKRLDRLVGSHRSEDGVALNYLVYLSPEVNAFAAADGSVRVYQGLMDATTDAELQCVIGHEIGHVVLGHSKEKQQLATMARAGRDYASRVGGESGALAQGQVGAIAESVLNAKFSQSEESEADEYGLAFMRRNGFDAEGCVSVMEKFAQLGSRGGGFFDSHPDPKARAAALRKEIASEGGSAPARKAP